MTPARASHKVALDAAMNGGAVFKTHAGGDRGRPNWFLENPKSKSQIPNQFQGLKFQNPEIGSRVGTWSLEFIWALNFGIWNFAHGMENF